MTTGEIRERAAQLIEQYGWIQGHYGNCDTGYCVLGALQEVCPDIITQVRAEDTLHPLCDMEGYSGLASWNDARGRTKEDVLNLFRGTYVPA